MRTFLVITLALAGLVFTQHALAAASVFIEDPVADQRISSVPTWLGPFVGVSCRDAATDVRAFSLFSDEEFVTVNVTVSDVGSRFVTCGGLHVERASASWSADIGPSRSVCPPEDLTCAPYGESVRFSARDAGLGIEGCIEVSYPEGVYSPCLGELVVEGNTFGWRLPIRGAFVSDAGDERTYDLVGDLVGGGAGARSNVGALFTTTVLTDSITAFDGIEL